MQKRIRPLGVALTTLTLALAPALTHALTAQQPTGGEAAAQLKQTVEQLRASGSVRVAGAALTRSEPVLAVYERGAFQPLWTRAAVANLLAAVRGAAADGLEPAHYHLAELAGLAEGVAQPAGPEAAAALDLLATDALHRLARDLRFGRVEPSGPTTGRDAPSAFGGSDPAADLTRVIREGRPAAALAGLRPTHFVYQGLVRALAELRALEAAGGWPTLPSGRSLRRDSADARVPLLRERLIASGDLARGPTGAAMALPPGSAALDPTLFDEALEAAVRRFQHRHGLNEDGVVGPATLAELNVPVSRRIEQLRINLERARWVTQGLPQTFVAVNVAGARVYFVRAGNVAFESRVIVGRDYTRTPVFSAPMRYIDLNPTWTVPPGIVGEVLARVRREPGYLAAEGMRVLDRSGRPVAPSSVDFTRYTGSSFPYVFRQDAGPANPLGRLKLVFPNEYNVYLHDTPSRSLFEREERLFSHGCIRVQDPVGLAEQVLNDPVRWSRAQIEQEIDKGATRTIPLTEPLPVLILYWTASADLHGELHFYRDVYGRDAALLAQLNRR